MRSTWGNNLQLTIFGESHGAAIGMVVDGLPIGLGLLGRPFDEATLYRAAFALEQAGRHGGQNGKGA